MLTKDEKKKIKRYKRYTTQFSSRAKTLCLLMMSIWIVPCSLISLYYWKIDINIEYPIMLPMIFFVSIFVVLLFERELLIVNDEFKKYLIFYSAVTVCLNVLFLIDLYLVFLAFLIAPINAFIFVYQCNHLHSKIINTKV